MKNPTKSLRLIITGSIACVILVTNPILADQDAHRHYFDVPWIGYDTGLWPDAYYPVSAETVDLDADGYPDLVSVASGGFLSVMMADGKGGYLPFTSYPMLRGASRDIAVADFDNDGDPDIVSADTGGGWSGTTVSLYLNDGAGVLTNFGAYSIGNSGPNGITAADFDGDGWIDVATANSAYIVCNNTMSVMLNRGSSGFNGFHPPQVYVLDQCTDEIDSGDLDGDGLPDLVVAHGTNRFTIMMNDGEGGFVNGAVIPGVTANVIPIEPTVHLADIDLDNDIDIFFSNEGTGGVANGSVGLWRNNGTGGFGAGEELSFEWDNGGGIDIETADVTGDGWPDIMCATGHYNNWFLFKSLGNGAFGTPQRLRAGHAPWSIEAPDLDQDGDLDIMVLANLSFEACVYLNPGDGTFVQPPTIDLTSPNLDAAFGTNLETGDIDADGDLDLVIGFRSDFSNSNGISLRRNNGDGTFGPRETYSDSAYPRYIRLCDIDADSDLDLVWLDEQDRFQTRFNDGTGGFGPRIDSQLVGRAGYFEMHDVDNDSDLDIVACAQFDIAVLMNNGSGTFLPRILTEVGGFYVLGMGDFDGDGYLDALTESAAQAYPEISFGHGNGHFGPTYTVPTGRDVHSFGVGHIDHDGVLDFAAIYNLDEKGLSIRRGRGDGNFFLNQNYHGSFQSDDYTLGGTTSLVDIDGDGNIDILFANEKAQDFSFWKGNGDGTFLDLVRYGAANDVEDHAIGDFTGDGVLDIMMSVRTDAGRGWYPSAVLIRGIDQNPIGGPAELLSVSLLKGTILAGDINDLRTSDDLYLHTQSGFGESFVDLHHMEMTVSAQTDVPSPISLNLAIESRIDQPAGLAQIRLLNYATGQHDVVGQYPLGNADAIDTLPGIDATNYVSPQGEIEVSITHLVFVPYLAFTFESWIDNLVITVE